MRQAIISSQRHAEVIDVPTPRPVADWALVRVTIAPMCTEYKAWQAGGQHRFLGHEAVGEVVEVAQSGRVQPGDRVVVMPTYPCGVCRYCVSGDYIHCQHTIDPSAFTHQETGWATYAQYLLKPDWLLAPIPDAMPYERAALALCALGPTMGALERLQVDAFDTLLITGAGPVGLGGVVNGRFRGARVLVVEGHPWRAQRARELGAEAVLDPVDPALLAQILDATDGLGVDAAVDCSGVPSAQRTCIDATRRLGQVCFVGECSQDVALQASRDMIRKGLAVHGSWHYNLSLYPKVLQVIEQSPVIDRLVSHAFPLEQTQEALAICASHDCAKVLLRPWDD